MNMISVCVSLRTVRMTSIVQLIANDVSSDGILQSLKLSTQMFGRFWLLRRNICVLDYLVN